MIVAAVGFALLLPNVFAFAALVALRHRSRAAGPLRRGALPARASTATRYRALRGASRTVPARRRPARAPRERRPRPRPRRDPRRRPAPAPPRRRLRLLAVFMVAEVVAGFATDSLALLSDAGHMLTDVLGLGMALAAIQLASRGRERRHRTFGLYRLEILAALANAVLLFGVAVYVLIEAVGRFDDPPEVLGVPMLVVATARPRRQPGRVRAAAPGSKESLNVEGAYLEVLADTVRARSASSSPPSSSRSPAGRGSTPSVGVAIGLWILPRTWRLGRQAVRILVQAAPPGIDLDASSRPRRARRGRRCARPARVDPHLGHGGRLRPSHGRRRHRQPRRARPGPGPAARPPPHRPRHPAGRTRRPPGCDEVAW